MINEQDHESACKTLALYLSKCGLEKFIRRERVLTFNPKNLRYILARIRALERDDTVLQGQNFMSWLTSWTNSDALSKSEIEQIQELIQKTPVLTLKSRSQEKTELDLVMFEQLKILDIRKCTIVFVGSRSETPLSVNTLYLRESKVDLNYFKNLTKAVLRHSPGVSFRNVDPTIISNLNRLEVTHGTTRTLAEVLQIYVYKNTKKLESMDTENTDSDAQSTTSSSSTNIKTSSSSSHRVHNLYSSMHTFVCTHNGIDMLDSSLKFAPALKKLNLMHNKIRNFNIYEGHHTNSPPSTTTQPSTPMSPRSVITDQFEDEFEYNFLPSITHLNLSYNQLVMWPSSRPYLLLNLTHLDVSHNHLSTTTHIEFLPRLTVLNLGYNEFSQWEEIEKLSSSLRQLGELTLKGNQELESKYDYRAYACGYFRLLSKFIFDGTPATRYELDYHYHQKVALLGDKDKVFDDAVLESSDTMTLNLNTETHPVTFDTGTFSTISDMTDLMDSPMKSRKRRKKKKRRRNPKRQKKKMTLEMNADDQTFFQSMGQHVGDDDQAVVDQPSQMTMNYQEKLQLMENMKEKYGALWLEAYNDYLHRNDGSPLVKKEDDTLSYILPGDRSDLDTPTVPSAGEKSSESGTDDSLSRASAAQQALNAHSSQFLNSNIQVFQNFMKKKHHQRIELNLDIRSFLEPIFHHEIEVDYVKEQHYFQYKDTSMDVTKDTMDIELPDEELDQLLSSFEKKLEVTFDKVEPILKFLPQSTIHASSRRSRRKIHINMAAMDLSSLPEHEKAKWEEKERKRQAHFESYAENERKKSMVLNSVVSELTTSPTSAYDDEEEEQDLVSESEDMGLSEYEAPETVLGEFSESDGESDQTETHPLKEQEEKTTVISDHEDPLETSNEEGPSSSSVVEDLSSSVIEESSVVVEDSSPSVIEEPSSVEEPSINIPQQTIEKNDESLIDMKDNEDKSEMNLDEESNLDDIHVEDESPAVSEHDEKRESTLKENLMKELMMRHSNKEEKPPINDDALVNHKTKPPLKDTQVNKSSPNLSLQKKPKRRRGYKSSSSNYVIPVRKPSVLLPNAPPLKPTTKPPSTKPPAKPSTKPPMKRPPTKPSKKPPTTPPPPKPTTPPTQQSNDDDDVLFESYFWKQGGKIKNWKRRLFTIYKTHWSYGELRSNTYKIYGTGNIEDVITVQRDSVGRVPSKCRAFSAYGLTLSCRKGKSKKRTFKILAESEEDCTAMVNTFAKVMAMSYDLFSQQDDDLETDASIFEDQSDEDDEDNSEDEDMMIDGDAVVSKLLIEGSSS